MREKQMESECMRECMRKLAVWYTRTFRPLITHDELEPIMSTLGFVSLPCQVQQPTSTTAAAAAAVSWKEYFYSAGGCRLPSHSSEPLPRPRLPYPRIDGLHIYTYMAFLDAVNFYLEMANISDLFHIRGMPLHRVNDRSNKWCRMEEDNSVFVYKEGTLDQAICTFYQVNQNDFSSSNTTKGCKTIIRNKGKSSPPGCIVPLKDIMCDHNSPIISKT